MPLRLRFPAVPAHADRRFGTFTGVALVLLLAGYAAVLARGAMLKALWHDEIYTSLLADLPVTDVFRASAEGVDLMPPLNVLLTHGSHALFGSGRVTTRLPPIAGFLAATTALFLLVQRRAGVLVAICAALVLALSGAWPFAVEARGYAVAMGCFGVALYAWAEASAGRAATRHLLSLAVALGAGLWAHYFFVLAFVPLLLAELTRQWQQRRVDRRPWLAFFGGIALAAPLLPLLAGGSAQRTTFWSRPELVDWWALRDMMLGRLHYTNLRRLAVALAIIAAVELTRRALRRWPRDRRFPAHEVVCGIACLALPACGYLLGLLTGVFHERYVSFTLVGLVAAVTLGAWSMLPRSRLLEGVAVAVLLHGWINLADHALRDPPPPVASIADHPLLMDALGRGERVVLNGGVGYLMGWHRAPADVKPRLLYLADPELQRRKIGSDTIDRGYLALARWTSLPALPMETFLAAHSHFLFYASGDDWVVAGLRERASLREVASDAHGVLYEVTAGPGLQAR